MEEVIKGLNKEKEILITKLVSLVTINANIVLRSSIEKRLKEIDLFIKELLKTTNLN